MKTKRLVIMPAVVLLLLTVSNLSADTHYVSSGSTQPTPPYTNWTTAATNIQVALDAASADDVVLVTNGVYTGGLSMTRPLSLLSVNGPQCTIIDGGGWNRCACLDTNALLSGFTLTNGMGVPGGGVRCDSSAVVSNCVLVGNTAAYWRPRGWGLVWGPGGGIYGGTARNCVLTRNSAGGGQDGQPGGGGAASCVLYNSALNGNQAQNGGGAASCTLHNCTLTENSAGEGAGGGAFACALNNCLVYFNTATNGANYDASSRLNYCCTTPLPANGNHNIVADPRLVNREHLSASSPCRGTGNAAFAQGVDIDGEPWANPPAIGCDEFRVGAVTGPLTVGLEADFTNVAVGYPVNLIGRIEGRATEIVWDFGDGDVAVNQKALAHAWTEPGEYPVTLWAFNDSLPAGVSASLTVRVDRGEYFVAAGNTNPVAPYASWTTAATNIQDAVEAASVGALVLVADGLYASGGRPVTEWEPNRVLVDKRLTLRSVNGPQFTVIDGSRAMRCAYLANGAVLSGFTLTNGYTFGAGGGVWGDAMAVVSNCLVVGNCACGGAEDGGALGGGAYGGTLYDCTLTGNVTWRDSLSYSFGGGAYASTLYCCALTGNDAEEGAGAYESTLYNCTVTGNKGSGAYYSTLYNCTVTGNDGPGACDSMLHNCTLTGHTGYYGIGACRSTLYHCTVAGNDRGAVSASLFNSIVYYNIGGNYDRDTVLNYCCTTPLPAGIGNLAEEPQMAKVTRLSANSPCIGRGSPAYASGVDADGEPWANPPCIGCDEYRAGSVTGPIDVSVLAAYTNVAMGFGVDFQAGIAGAVSASRWNFGDGTVVSNRPWAAHAWAAAGDYVVELRAYNDSFPAGVAATVTVHVVREEHYVAVDSVTPLAPYTSWATAARSIQEAVDAASQTGALVWVSNGVYQAGGRAVYGLSNRVAVTQPVRVRSVNGPAVTRIVGHRVTGAAAVRCVYLARAAVLDGFTLANGATQIYDAYSDWRGQSGGGMWCEGPSALVSNCVLTGNSAENDGGGVFGGTLNHCTLTGNSAGFGGGAYWSTLNGCVLRGNSAYGGGGACEGTLNHCTLTANSADYGAGASWSTLNNCITYYNNARFEGVNYHYCTLNYCCTTPLPTNGVGNIISAPAFVDANGLRLQTNSPCINAGNTAYACGDTDLDGNPRIAGATVDIGAYEFQGDVLSGFTAWLWQYGLPIDGSADTSDPDQDNLNNRQEWVCATCPTNSQSALHMLSPTLVGMNLVVTWQSTVGVDYYLERSTDLASPFSLLATNLVGQAGFTSYEDTNSAGLGPFFYRVGVSHQ